MKRIASFAILGSGNAGATIAAHLKLMGHAVSLYDAFPIAVRDIQKNHNTIVLEGNLPVTGEAKIDTVTVRLDEAVRGADVMICTTPAHVHKLLARDLARYLKPQQTVVLYPGRTGGVLEFRKVVQENGGTTDALIVETQTIAYACRKTGATVHVFGVKQELPFAGLPVARLDDFTRQIKEVFPNWVRAESLWHTSLHNIGMLFHPTPTLLNIGRMESGIPFDYYIDGFTPSIAKIVEQLDTERLAVAKAMGVQLPTVLQWLKSSYGCSGSNLYNALQNNQAYVGIKAPSLKHIDDKKQLRYVIEDVPTGLVPVAALGERFGVPTPTMNAVIDLADVFFEINCRATGRTLKQLGLAEKSNDQIRQLT